MLRAAPVAAALAAGAQLRTMRAMQDAAVADSTHSLPVWPESQKLIHAGDPNIVITHFDDAPKFHPALAETIVKLSRGSEFVEPLVRGSCGTKVHHIDRWGSPEADLVFNRAKAMFTLALREKSASVDASWANVYRRNDYCVPHSHIRAQASVVYMVDEGEVDEKDRLAGKLYFADTRIAYCAQHEQGRLTRLLIPEMRPGTMVMFPGMTVHAVNPYFGQKPRITMSWNINAAALPGDPRQEFFTKMGDKPR